MSEETKRVEDSMDDVEKVDHLTKPLHFECKEKVASVMVLDYGYVLFRTHQQELLWNYKTNTTMKLFDHPILDAMILSDGKLGFVTSPNHTFHLFAENKVIRSKQMGQDYWMSMPLASNGSICKQYKNKVYFQASSHHRLYELDLETLEITTVFETHLFIQNAIVCDYGIVIEYTNDGTFDNEIVVFQDKEMVFRIASAGKDCYVKGMQGNNLLVRIDAKLVSYDLSKLELVSEAYFTQLILNILFTKDELALVGSETIYVCKDLNVEKEIPMDTPYVCVLHGNLYSISHDKTTFTPIE